MMTNAARMAKYTNTPSDYYTSLPIAEFHKWIGVLNDMIREDNIKKNK